MSALNNPWLILGVTMIGIVTAVSAFVVEIVQEKKRKATLNRELCEMRSLRDQVTRLQLQICDLNNAQKNMEQKKSHRKLDQENRRTRSRTTKTCTATSVTSDTDWNSTQDSSDLEFYDLSSDDEDSRASTVRALDVVLEAIDNRLESNHDEFGLKAIKGELLQFYTSNGGGESANQGDLLWRLAKCEYKLGQICDDLDGKSKRIQAAVDYCQQSTDSLLDKRNPRDETVGQLNKWLAICVGAQIELLTSTRDKIRSSIQFKRSLDAAAHHLPNDGTVQYMLGRWALEVGALPWLDRKALSVIAGADVIGVVGPEAALDYLVRANDMEECGNGDGRGRGSRETKVCLAKALLEARDDVLGAVKHLQDALHLPPENDKVDIELKTLLAKYNSYT